jgi:hypothetical protein
VDGSYQTTVCSVLGSRAKATPLHGEVYSMSKTVSFRHLGVFMFRGGA